MSIHRENTGILSHVVPKIAKMSTCLLIFVCWQRDHLFITVIAGQTTCLDLTFITDKRDTGAGAVSDAPTTSRSGDVLEGYSATKGEKLVQ